LKVLDAAGLGDNLVNEQIESSSKTDFDSVLNYVLTGDQSPSFDADTDRLHAQRDEGLSPDELDEKRLARLTDQDTQYRLDRSFGEGDDRLVAEHKMLGREQMGEVYAASNDAWGGLEATRAAIEAMSPEEREYASSDEVFRKHITDITDGRPGAYEELIALLDQGADTPIAMLHDAAGSGVQKHWLTDEPWKAVEALSSKTAQAELALFVARHGAVLVNAIGHGEMTDVATAMFGLASDVSDSCHPRDTCLSRDGWRIADADCVLRPKVHAAAEMRCRSATALDVDKWLDSISPYDKAISGD
jgi:hypothetical protein